jgi:hypothetical protein
MEAAPFAYFWPTYGIFAFSSATVLISWNLTLYVLCICLYYLIPTPIMEEAARTVAKQIRSYFKDGFDKIERNIAKTFKMKIRYPIPDKSINIWHPHGLLAVTPGIHNSYRITNPNYPPSKMVTANIFHLFPFVKDWMSITNTISADYEIIKKTLDTTSVSIILGGAKEMYLSEGKKLKLVINERKGVFKLALETGRPLVPIITYGESELFPTTKNSAYICIREFLYDMWKIPFAIPTLTSLQNWLSLWDGPLNTVRTYTGRPIYVKKKVNVTDKHIRTLRNIYIERVQELFEKTNPGTYELEII